MPRKKPAKDNDNADVSNKDLFGSIPKPLDVDPFDGIDLRSLSIFRSDEENKEDQPELSQVNPIEGVDLEDISILKKGPPLSPPGNDDIGEINSLSGIDTRYIGVDPERHKEGPAPQLDVPTAVEPKKAQFQSEASAKETSPTRKKLSKAYRYAEINRLRENIVKTLQQNEQKTVLFIAPHDDAGNTFLVSVLGFNAAYFTNMSVLLIDLNMRRPFLHDVFGVKRENGFSEIAMGSLDWRDSVKDTGLAELKIITAGKPTAELSFFLNRAFIKTMITDVKEDFELIFIDTSPVLVSNINNVDPVYLSRVCDMVVLVVQDKITSKTMLIDSVETIKNGGGEVNAIVYNKQF
ncbi:MAG: CpsD/CapB family tyrosine-protein kinase [Deltaproteobacteria bacterium]|nr:CpsD/CapB family tyrosine-protein kinase [Deltaproteobacteria bacterium]